MRITPELISRSEQRLNCLGDRELDLRANRIPAIENLGSTLDQFDSIDLTENVIGSLEGFPPLPRLRVLLLSNNHIARVMPGLGSSLPNLETLALSGNWLGELADLEPLRELKKLRHVVLLENPVRNVPHYREFLVHTIPSLVAIDLTRIRSADRDQARKVFKRSKGEEAEKLTNSPQKLQPRPGIQLKPSKEQLSKIRNAIVQAKSLKEVEALEKAVTRGDMEFLLMKIGE